MKDFIQFLIGFIICVCFTNYCTREDKTESLTTVSVRTIKTNFIELDSIWKNVDLKKK